MRAQMQGALVAFLFFSWHVQAQHSLAGQPVYHDRPYLQKFSVRYNVLKKPSGLHLQKVGCDRNGVVQVLSSDGLLKPSGGALLYPGTLVPDRTYKPITDKKISDLAMYNKQFVYLDDQAIFSNAWAGKLYAKHSLPSASLVSAGVNFSFLVADENTLEYIQDSSVQWQGRLDDKILGLQFDATAAAFLILTEKTVSAFSVTAHTLQTLVQGKGFTCFAISPNTKELLIGTHHGYLIADATTGKIKGEAHDNLPSNDITTIKKIDEQWWFGSTGGGFMLRKDKKFDYYASARWLPSDRVIDIAAGDHGNVLILTDNGLAELHFQQMTLADKAVFFEKQVRARHIRNGFNATIINMKDGDPNTGVLEDSDNDGLWTSMYLGGEVFRYAVTRSPEALQNCRESMDAMERLYTINPLKGFPARSFERRGYAKHDVDVWKNAPNPGWDWKSTTSSDEAIGHIFVFGAMAELMDDADLRSRAIKLIDALMQHIVDHDMYLVDWNGEPTRWGRWNPEYVNARPEMVGDRKITSSNIVAMLQTAYHFTHKKIYKDKALELMQKHGFLQNLMKPMKEIDQAPADADDLSRELSDGWNHSDDEMYFLGYWGLYRYALNDTLKAKFRAAIIDHWQAERPEREAAWNIVTAMTGTKDFDLQESVNYLQRYPLDLINWRVTNSKRKDVEFIPGNFRRQTIKEVLPPDEMPVYRHNANLFELDGGDEGKSENSAGDIWLFPYWLARYLGVISAAPKTPQ